MQEQVTEYDNCEKAKELFRSIADWRDSNERIVQCDRKEKRFDRAILIALLIVVIVVSTVLIIAKVHTVKKEAGALSFRKFFSESWLFLIRLLVFILCATVFCLVWRYYRVRGSLFWKDEKAVSIVTGCASGAGAAIVLATILVLPAVVRGWVIIVGLLAVIGLAGYIINNQ